jgi:hypothetical protein
MVLLLLYAQGESSEVQHMDLEGLLEVIRGWGEKGNQRKHEAEETQA